MPKKQVNFKLPPELVDALDIKASQENTNRTELVIQGIRSILGLSQNQSTGIDKRVDEIENRLRQVETHCIDESVDARHLKELENRINQLESQWVEGDIYNHLHDLAHQIEELKTSLNRASKAAAPTKQGEDKPLQEEISDTTQQKLTLTELAKRLGVDRSNLAKIRKNKTAIELAVYTKGRDPQGIAWQFDTAEEVFKPV
jgi:hypothetical protein